MTKAEELKVLDKIETLIKSAGDDSYIALTFTGIVEVCRNNIRDDFGDAPVADCERLRKMHEDANHLSQALVAERDKLQEDFDALAAAYLEAVQAADVARYYIHAAREKLRVQVDELPVTASNEEIGAAVREHKKAKEALRRCCAVVEDSQKLPMRRAVNMGS